MESVGGGWRAMRALRRMIAKVWPGLALPKSLVRTRLTPKGHVVEVHLAAFARRYGTIGFFGEDGIEALHPKDTKCRQLTRCIRNPESRGLATTRHLTRIQCGKGVANSQFHRKKRARVNLVT